MLEFGRLKTKQLLITVMVTIQFATGKLKNSIIKPKGLGHSIRTKVDVAYTHSGSR